MRDLKEGGVPGIYFKFSMQLQRLSLLEDAPSLLILKIFEMDHELEGQEDKQEVYSEVFFKKFGLPGLRRVGIL